VIHELCRLTIDFIFAFEEAETWLLCKIRVKADEIWGT